MVIGNKVDLVEDGLATQTVTANEGVVLAHVSTAELTCEIAFGYF